LYRQYYSMWDTEKSVIDINENSNPNYDYINEIKPNYLGFSADKLNSLEVTYFYLNYFLVILNFLVIFGLLEIVIVSFYRHEILKKKSILSGLL
jgi:hypothetical protein